MAEYRAGSLVKIHDLKDKVDDITEGFGELEKVDVNGEKAQLLSWDDSTKHWVAMTFSGVYFEVPQANLAPLQPDELRGIDLIVGPGSDEKIVAEEMANCLIQKGYCVSRMFTAQAYVNEMLYIAEDLQYKRVASEIEPHYLGIDSKERVRLLDFESEQLPDAVYGSSFYTQDSTLDAISGYIQPYLKECLGIKIATRTNMMVRQTFKDDAEEASYPSPIEPSNAEKHSFMVLAKRRRVCIMQFLGPLTGNLRLIARDKDQNPDNEIEISAEPGTTVIFLTERFSYSFTCLDGRTTTLQTWLLASRGQFQMGKIGGDMSVIGNIPVGATPPRGETVCIDGCSTFLPADSKNAQCFWIMFNKAGVDTHVKCPITRWDTAMYCDTSDIGNAQSWGKSYTWHYAHCEGVECFDSSFFGISPAESASMDPNQRKTLETIYQCIAQGGYTLKDLNRTSAAIGSFVGISGSEWGNIPHPVDSAGCGGAEAIIANRCAFSLNLKGASITMNTACSAGLVAIHVGKLHLKFKEFDTLAGSACVGENMCISPLPFIGCCSGNMLSFKGRSFSFDTGADGYARGEGAVGVFEVIKPWSQMCYGLMAGSQANQDGRSASITAPNGPSQEKCIRAAFREANLDPPEVDCFECHGTGTALGDPIEVGAFRRIYNAFPRKHTLQVTSSKSNLGHLEGGAGATGFVKCLLQVMRAEASPNQHLRQTNAHLDVDGFPALFLCEGNTCMYDSSYSGVSSFGFGGTNAHGMAYGKNVQTSRSLVHLDMRKAMLRKIEAAAKAPEILMSSPNPEDWETTGMPVVEDSHETVFQVEIKEDGSTIWRELMPEPVAHTGERFYVSGSFNDWGVTQMQTDPSIPQLFTLEIVTTEPQTKFCIQSDENPDMKYYPAVPDCPSKAVQILGPDKPEDPEHACWLIQSALDESAYRIEFFKGETSVTVNWIRIKGRTVREGGDGE